MIRNALIVAAALAAVVRVAPAASAQPLAAEVRTWTGQVYQLADSSLEVLYTIAVPKPDGGAGSPPPPPPAPTGVAAPMLFGTTAALGSMFEEQPEPLQGQRQSETITLRKDGTEIRLPLASIATLFFVRQAVPSGLPSYVARAQYRYAATAVLTDGSRIEADYVSLGTTFLRGRTTLGRVDIPWEQIELVRFTR